MVLIEMGNLIMHPRICFSFFTILTYLSLTPDF
jgi:hypothetical protein